MLIWVTMTEVSTAHNGSLRPSASAIASALIAATVTRRPSPSSTLRDRSHVATDLEKSIKSHLEELDVARLDVFALRQHRGGIGLEQFQPRQWRMTGLFLDRRMERAKPVIVDQQLLAFGAEEEALEQPRGIGIGRATEYA